MGVACHWRPHTKRKCEKSLVSGTKDRPIPPWQALGVADYEVLEHTADVGLRARAATLEELFARATEGMAVIAGAWHPGPGAEVDLEVDGTDLGSVLVDWLSEVLYVQDARNASIAAVRLDRVTETSAIGAVVVREFAGEPSEGVQIKAVTFHQLDVDRGPHGWVATVFFDI